MTPAKTKRIEAIRASIAAWEEKRDESSPHKIHLGGSGCPLCVEFRRTNDDEEGCGDCPVRKHTGMSYCIDTPYSRASHALAYWERCYSGSTAQTRWITAAQAEIDFLKMLEAKELAK